MAKLKEGRGTLTLNIFKSDELNWLLRRVLIATSEKGAEIGECLYAASRINEKDLNSWIREWSELGKRVHQQGENSLQRNAKVSARESFLRAMTYYRAAEYLCSPMDDRAFPLWEASRKSFHKACLLFNPPIQVVEILFEGGIMPGYFWRPALDDKKRPTLVSVGGNDDSGEETFLWNGPAAVRRGYNYFTFEFPGHRGCVHLNPSMVKRPDYEKPFSAAIDFLKEQKGVDERIALAGHSHGGYAVCRAAIYDKRIKALIPSTPLIDADAAGAKMFSLIEKFPDFLVRWLLKLKLRRNPEIKVLLEYVAWTLGYDDFWTILKDPNRPQFNFKGEESKIDCEVLALIGENEGEELMKQTKEFMRLISSEQKKLKIFTLKEDGSDDHCQLDNRIRANQVIFDWLDKVFRHY